MMAATTRYFALVWSLLVLTVSADGADGGVDQEVHESGNYLQAMERAATYLELAEIIGRIPEDHVTRERISLAAARSSNEFANLGAAMMLATVTDDGSFEKIAALLGKSKSKQLQRITALEQMIRAPSRNKGLVTNLIGSKDLLLRLMAILACDDWQLVRQSTTDPSEIVRACAVIRLTRLGEVAGVEKEELRLLCNQILVDPCDTVRSAALAFASKLQIFPVDTLSGLLFDSRPQVWLSNVFSDEEEGLTLRKRLNITEESDWAMHRFSVALGLQESAIRRYPTEPTMPIGQPFYLGSYAAYLLKQTTVSIEPIAEQIRLNVEESFFKRQLLKMLSEREGIENRNP